MRITIRDVARQLNLSITTVSRALDGYNDVSEGTRKLVVETAHKMGYVPNRAARQLRRQRTDTIGYILPGEKLQFADSFFSEFVAGLGDEAAANNYDLLVSTASLGSEAERDLYTRWVQGRKVDGIVINRILLHDWRVRYLSEQEVPFVSLERSPEVKKFIGIEVDSRAGVLALMAHLVGLSHRHIAYVGASTNLKIESDRLEGYRGGLKEAGLPFDTQLVAMGDLTAASGFNAAERLLSLKDPPTAIVCVNDLTAIGVMHAINEHHLRVGQDIAVAGFDGIPDTAHTQPPLTTLHQPVYDIARDLSKMLLACINGQPPAQTDTIVRPELIVRASTQPH